MSIDDEAGWASWLIWMGPENLAPIGSRITDRSSRRESAIEITLTQPPVLNVAGTIKEPVRCWTRKINQARSQNCEKRPFASSCPSVSAHGTTRLLLDEFS